MWMYEPELDASVLWQNSVIRNDFVWMAAESGDVVVL